MYNGGNVYVTNYTLKLLLQVKGIHPFHLAAFFFFFCFPCVCFSHQFKTEERQITCSFVQVQDGCHVMVDVSH